MNSTALHQQGLSMLPQSEQTDILTNEMQSTISPNSPQMDSVGQLGQNLTFPKLNEIRRPPASTNETKVIYHLEDKDCPTVIKIPISPNVITLRDLKTFLSLPKSYFKFYFKSFDKDVGVVKEQIFDDNSILPLYQNMVVAFIESAESANSKCTSEISNRISRPDGTNDQANIKRIGLLSDSTFHSSTDHCGDTTETESMISSRRGGQYLSPRHRIYNCKSGHHARYGKCSNRYHRSGHHHGHYADSSVVTSDMESYVDSEDDYDDDFMENDVDSDDDYDDYSSRISTTTEETSVSRQYVRKHRTRRRYKNNRNQNMSRTSSISSISEAMSFNVIQVILNLDVVNYLGISLVGQTSQKGDGGIYVSSIMAGGAVALDGRIQIGDMILQVNDINFNMLTNDEAVQVIREAVKKPGPIKLLVAKVWENMQNPKGYFTIPRSEPVRPIDPGAWVAHTEAARAKYTNHDTNLPLNGSMASYAVSNSISSSISESDRQLFQQPQVPVSSVPSFANSVNSFPLTNSSMTYSNSLMPSSPLRNSMKSGHNVTISSNPATTIQVPPPLTTESNLESIACAMASPESGLDVRDRMWLKIRIPNAFIGSDVVNWLFSYVQGFRDRKDAKKFASKLLKQGFIQHTINLKNSFSEKCYYVFSDLVFHKTTEINSGTNQVLTGLEEGFSNGLRLTNENFQQSNGTFEQSNFTPVTNQQFGLNLNDFPSNVNLGHVALTSLNQSRPGLPGFMRYWDENSEIQNYGLFGPHLNSDVIANSATNDGTGSNHSGGGTNCHDPYQSDEQMSQRSGQSVLYNPQAVQGINPTNTMASSGSNGSRHTNTSNHQSNISNGNSNTNNLSGNNSNGNILNHHYEDLQMNPHTGNLVPTSSLTNDELNEYHQQYAHNGHNNHVFAQVYRHHESDEVTNGEMNDVNSALISNGTSTGNHEGLTNYHIETKSKPKKGFFKTSLTRQGSLNGQSTGNVMRNSFRKAMGKP